MGRRLRDAGPGGHPIETLRRRAREPLRIPPGPWRRRVARELGTDPRRADQASGSRAASTMRAARNNRSADCRIFARRRGG